MGIVPEGKHREELLDELVQKERDIAKAKEKAKADAKARKDRIGALESRRDEILDLLEGRDSVQPEIPFTTGKLGKKVPEPLKWEKEGDNQVAPAGTLGRYCVEPRALGAGFNVLFTPVDGKSKVLSTTPKTEAEAKAVAQKDWLERAADAALENAGDGKLTKAGRAKIARMEGRS